MLVGSGLPGTRFPGTTRPGGERSDVVAFWPGHGPLQTARGLVPVQITGPERYVEGTRGPALLVERASTNLVSNPRGGAGSTAPWIADGASLAPEAIVDGTAPHGTAIRLAGHSGNIARIYEPIESQAPSLAQGTRYSAHFHARALNAAAIGEPLQALLWETGGASPNQITASLDATFTADWVEHQFTGTIQATGRTGFQFLAGPPYTQAAVGAEYGLTDIQVEIGEPTSYCDGSLGVGYSWEGGVHASPSGREATVASLRIAELRRGASIVLLMRPSWGDASPTERTLLTVGAGSVGFDGSGNWRLTVPAGELVSPASHSPGQRVLLAVQWGRDRVCLAVGSTGEVAAAMSMPVDEVLRIGSDPTGVDASLGMLQLLPQWPGPRARHALGRI